MSGGSDKAARQAQASEDARMRAIRNTQGAVNRVFESPERQADIGNYVGALRDYYTGDLNEQKTNTDRELKFALARGGQVGGSVQVDKTRDVNRDYAKGLLKVDRKARGAGAELESADQDARSRLLGLATSGLDATSGASMSAAALRSNLESGRSAAQLQGIGDVFGGGLSEYFKQAADAKVRRQAYSAYGSMYDKHSGYGG